MKYLSFYFLYEPNRTLRVSTTTPELKCQNSNPRGKMVQKVNFSPVGQNNNLSLNLNPTCQQESRGMFGFQNRAPDVKILKFHVDQDNSAYFEKCDFQQKLIFRFWDCY